MKMKIYTQPSNVYTLSHSKIQNCDLLSVLWLLPLPGGCSCWPPLSTGLQKGRISPPGCNMWSHLVRLQHKSLLLDRPEQFLSYNTLYMCWIFNQPCCTKTILNTASGMKILIDKFNHDSFPARWQVKLKQTITVHELYAYQHIILDESFNKVTLLNFRGGLRVLLQFQCLFFFLKHTWVWTWVWLRISKCSMLDQKLHHFSGVLCHRVPQ